MQKVNILLVDDIDGTEASQTITFGLDGKVYEIDLNDKNAVKLRKVLDPYLQGGRWVTGTKHKKKSDSNAAQVREWANKNGFTLAPRGAIPREVKDAYSAAH